MERRSTMAVQAFGPVGWLGLDWMNAPCLALGRLHQYPGLVYLWISKFSRSLPWSDVVGADGDWVRRSQLRTP